MNKIDFLKASKQEQIEFLEKKKLAEYVISSEFELAEKLHNFLIKYKKKEFSLDVNIDLEEYVKMLKVVF